MTTLESCALTRAGNNKALNKKIEKGSNMASAKGENQSQFSHSMTFLMDQKIKFLSSCLKFMT